MGRAEAEGDMERHRAVMLGLEGGTAASVGHLTTSGVTALSITVEGEAVLQGVVEVNLLVNLLTMVEGEEDIEVLTIISTINPSINLITISTNLTSMQIAPT